MDPRPDDPPAARLIGLSLAPHDFPEAFVSADALGGDANLRRVLDGVSILAALVPQANPILPVYDRDGFAWTGPLPPDIAPKG